MTSAITVDCLESFLNIKSLFAWVLFFFIKYNYRKIKRLFTTRKIVCLKFNRKMFIVRSLSVVPQNNQHPSSLLLRSASLCFVMIQTNSQSNTNNCNNNNRTVVTIFFVFCYGHVRTKPADSVLCFDSFSFVDVSIMRRRTVRVY